MTTEERLQMLHEKRIKTLDKKIEKIEQKKAQLKQKLKCTLERIKKRKEELAIRNKKIIELDLERYSNKDIAQRFNIREHVVQNIVQDYKKGKIQINNKSKKIRDD
jgi:DNA-binding NarL/FixJ family response regulator